MSQQHTLIQSYVMNQFFVSTIYRQSSAAIPNAPWYYETIGWDWDLVTKERGKMLVQEDSGRDVEMAIMSHARVCNQLTETILTDQP